MSSSSCNCSTIDYNIWDKISNWRTISQWESSLQPSSYGNRVASYHENNNRLWVGQGHTGRKLPYILNLRLHDQGEWLPESFCIKYFCNNQIWVLNLFQLVYQMVETDQILMNPINGKHFSKTDLIFFKNKYEKAIYNFEHPSFKDQMQYHATKFIQTQTGTNPNEYQSISYMRRTSLLLSVLIPGLSLIGASTYLLFITRGLSTAIGTLTTHADVISRIFDGSYTPSDIKVLRDTFGLRIVKDITMPSGFVLGQISGNTITSISRMLKRSYDTRYISKCIMTNDQYIDYVIFQNKVGMAKDFKYLSS